MLWTENLWMRDRRPIKYELRLSDRDHCNGPIWHRRLATVHLRRHHHPLNFSLGNRSVRVPRSAPLVQDLWSPLVQWFLGLTQYRLVESRSDRFSRFCTAYGRESWPMYRQTDRATFFCRICAIHAMRLTITTVIQHLQYLVLQLVCSYCLLIYYLLYNTRAEFSRHIRTFHLLLSFLLYVVYVRFVTIRSLPVMINRR